MFSTIMTFINAAIIQGIPLLFGATGEIITEKAATSTSESPELCMWAAFRA